MKTFIKYHIKDRVTILQKMYQLRAFKNHAPILVFTMAKVGSLSVYSSLKKQTNIPVFHIHTLNEYEILEGNNRCFEKGIYPDSRSPVPLINTRVINANKNYKVISLFRNPIERNLSAFFEAFQFHVGVKPENYKGTLTNLEAIFHEKVSKTYALDWYDHKLVAGIGIDIYKIPFDHEKRYVKIHTDKTDLLLMDSYLLDNIKSKVIGDFCGIDNFDLINANITSRSAAGNLYKAFKKHIRFSEKYLHEIINSKYFQHFYSPKEKEELLKKWSK